MKRRAFFLLTAVVFLMSACASSKAPPRSFSSHSPPGWTSIEIRDGVGYDRAWQAVNSFLVRDFDLALVEKEIGYVRTEWLNYWTGIYLENYRVRAMVKFSDRRDKIEVKTEAFHFNGKSWVPGTDSRLAANLTTGLMGLVGRTIR